MLLPILKVNQGVLAYYVKLKIKDKILFTLFVVCTFTLIETTCVR